MTDPLDRLANLIARLSPPQYFGELPVRWDENDLLDATNRILVWDGETDDRTGVYLAKLVNAIPELELLLADLRRQQEERAPKPGELRVDLRYGPLTDYHVNGPMGLYPGGVVDIQRAIHEALDTHERAERQLAAVDASRAARGMP